jgi:hypothetical protein
MREKEARNKGKKIFALALFWVLIGWLGPTLLSQEPGLVAWWKFDQIDKLKANKVLDIIGEIEDVIKGNFKYTEGVVGSALKLDGYTTCLIRQSKNVPPLRDEFTFEAWIALGAYPWNWCPILSQNESKKSGFYFAVGPRGQLSLQVALNGNWQDCTSPDFVIPLREWVHVAGVYDSSEGLVLYLNGRRVEELKVKGKISFAPDVDLLIGMNHEKVKPASIHREHGTLPGWFSLDGIIDEVKIYNRALTPSLIKANYSENKPKVLPDLPPRLMPSGPPGPGRFGAYYCQLKYYDEWDALWPVGPHPDVVVRFDNSAAKVVFWRGTRYSPVWVTDNGLWMADQSVEAWGVGEEDKEGCFEHMQDRHCRYSHVRIIENNAARVVVHWRYAPVSSHNHLWKENEKTGWACWVDEYYFIYPDVMGVRKVSWKKGSLGKPRQFQETLPLLQPGQRQKDVINADFAYVGNMGGESKTFSFIENPQVTDKWEPHNFNMQIINLKSKSKPFIIFEPGGQMYIFNKDIKELSGGRACDHWPVGQMPCDGRTTQAFDRPSHFLSFPITDPPVHEKEGRCWWNGLYGLTDKSIEELTFIAKSWLNAPRIAVKGDGFVSLGYDRSERVYKIIRKGNEAGFSLELEIKASKDSPIYNPALIILNWGEAQPELKIDGRLIPQGKKFRYGYRYRLEDTDLIIWLQLESVSPQILQLISQEK